MQNTTASALCTDDTLYCVRFCALAVGRPGEGLAQRQIAEMGDRSWEMGLEEPFPISDLLSPICHVADDPYTAGEGSPVYASACTKAR
jgi:hypothetical protein